MFVNSSDNDLSNRFLDGNKVTELDFFKKDVYDVDILLLELIIGKEPIQIKIIIQTIWMGVTLIGLLIFSLALLWCAISLLNLLLG